MNRFLTSIVGFIFVGMFIVALIAGLILFSYLLIYGAIVGLILFGILSIKEKFFTHKKTLAPKSRTKKTVGRTFDHDELKK